MRKVSSEALRSPKKVVEPVSMARMGEEGRSSEESGMENKNLSISK